MIGLSIGNYRILEKLNGNEAIGEYKAVDTPINRDVFIKVLGREFLDRADVLESFHTEAATLARMSHPSVPTLHSLTAVDGQLFMILEFFDGRKLDQILRNRGRFSVAEAVSVIIQILECLEYAGGIGIRHGDLKLRNVFITDDGNVKILGFGALSQTQAGETEISDVRAVGIIFYELLTGEKPAFESNETAELSILKQTIPEEFRETLVKALSRNEDENFQTAAEFRSALAEICAANEIPHKILISNTAGFEHASDAFFSKLSDNKNTADNDLQVVSETADGEIPVSVKQISLRKLRQKRYAAAVLAIFAVIVLHFVFQFSFIQKQNLKLIEDSAKAVNSPVKNVPETPQPKTDKALTETKKQNYESKFEDAEIKPKTASASPAQPRPEKSPPQRAIKKKESVESRAERLRRAEKILTGV